MECRGWLERVEAELRRRKLPPKLRARLLAELADHALDVAEAGFFSHRTKEGSTMTTEAMIEAKLGSPAELAMLAEAEARRGGWVRRHPLLVFGLMPLPMAVLALVLVELPAALVLGALDPLPRWATVAGARVMAHGLPFVPFMMAAAWLGRLGRRGVPRAWVAVGAAQLAVVAGTLVSILRVSDVPGESMWSLALAWPLGELLAEFGPVPPFTWLQGAQAAAPLVAAWWGSRRKG